MMLMEDHQDHMAHHIQLLSIHNINLSLPVTHTVDARLELLQLPTSIPELYLTFQQEVK